MKTKQVPALDLVKHESSRALHIVYQGKHYSGIRVSKRSKGQPTKLELSGFARDSVVADMKAFAVEIEPLELVSIEAK